MSCCVEDPPDVGTTVHIERLFETLVYPYTAITPGSVLFKTKDPEGTEQYRTVVQDADLSFYAEFVVPMSGQWRYRWEAGDPDRVFEGTFVVRRSEYAPYDPPGGPTHLTWGQLGAMPWGAARNLDWGDI